MNSNAQVYPTGGQAQMMSPNMLQLNMMDQQQQMMMNQQQGMMMQPVTAMQSPMGMPMQQRVMNFTAPPNMMASPMAQPPMYQPVTGTTMTTTSTTTTTLPVAQPMMVPLANPITPMFYKFPEDHPATSHMTTMARKLTTTSKLKIVQEITLLEACCGCEQQNIYSIYDESTGSQHILTAREKSDTCTRLCCNPCHSLMVEVADASNEDDVVVTLERPGVDCGTCAKPCLPCCVCAPACGESVTMHGGRVEGPAGNVSAPAPMVMLRQASAAESFFNPKINIKPAVEQIGGEDISLHVTGPTFFGGCSELCMRSSFPVTNNKGENAGTITKMPPKNFCGCLDEIATDSDTYEVEFNEGTCPEDKAALLASAILADYMFFEGDNGMCRTDPVSKKTKCTVIMCYCGGCVCPCNLELNNQNGGGGG